MARFYGDGAFFDGVVEVVGEGKSAFSQTRLDVAYSKQLGMVTGFFN